MFFGLIPTFLGWVYKVIFERKKINSYFYLKINFLFLEIFSNLNKKYCSSHCNDKWEFGVNTESFIILTWNNKHLKEIHGIKLFKLKTSNKRGKTHSHWTVWKNWNRDKRGQVESDEDNCFNVKVSRLYLQPDFCI